MSVQARFYVSQIVKNASGYVAAHLQPVIRGDQNKDWSKYTPSGKVELNVSPETPAAAWFESMLGKDIAITFEERDDDPADE